MPLAPLMSTFASAIRRRPGPQLLASLDCHCDDLNLAVCVVGLASGFEKRPAPVRNSLLNWKGWVSLSRYFPNAAQSPAVPPSATFGKYLLNETHPFQLSKEFLTGA